MRFTLEFKADRGGHLESALEVVDAVVGIHEELAAFCEGDASHAPLGRVELDLAVVLDGEAGFFDPGCSDACYEKGPGGSFLVPCERREHGYGMDLADVLAELECFRAKLWELFSNGACRLAPGTTAEVSVALTLATSDPLLAARLGFKAA